MRVFVPMSSGGSPASAGGVGSPQVGLSSFQTRLSAASGAPASSLGNASPSGAEILQHSQEQMRSLLRLQYQLSMGRDSLTSNVLKVRHETAKNAISNIR
ncbi:hypothetical protein [Hyalangium gracile]|uniref:hypothetical protein n=1 Tax=Hyalangium gracile TaxID=394092 RepID=UPI001CCD4F0C|nr:hypothetical protein [Hyalangium gracile]